MSESARPIAAADPRIERGEMLRAVALLGFAAVAAAASWTFSGMFRCEAGVVAAALVLVGWRGYFVVLASVLGVSVLMASDAERALL